MSFLKKYRQGIIGFLAGLLIAAITSPGSCHAQEPPRTSWTEVDVTFAGVPYVGDESFTVEPVLSVAVFSNNKGLGLFASRPDIGGPFFSWRMAQGNIPLLGDWFGWEWMWHLLTTTEWTDGGLFDDSRWGLDLRINAGTSYMDLSLLTLFESREGERTRYTPGVSLVFYPSEM